MKKFLILFFILLFALTSKAEILEAGVSIDHIPKALYGSWRVNAKLDTTNAPYSFKPQSIDFWELSRINDSITLNNPLSGANANISVQSIEGNLIVFSKKLPFDSNKILTDTITIRLDGNKFTGINSLCLEHYSLVDNHLLKTETASYHISGEKISGDSVLKN